MEAAEGQPMMMRRDTGVAEEEGVEREEEGGLQSVDIVFRSDELVWTRQLSKINEPVSL